MPLRGSDKALLAALVVFAAVSLTAKAMLGPTIVAPPSEGPQSVEARLVSILHEQGFGTSVRPLKIQSPIIYGTRGRCTLSVRNAFGGAAAESLYREDARPIGPIRYLYKGQIFNSPPTLRIHFAVIEASLLRSVGLRPAMHIPLALAASPGCGTAEFGFEDLQISA